MLIYKVYPLDIRYFWESQLDVFVFIMTVYTQLH